MKIIVKYLLTNAKERKLRTTVMLLSILLSTTLLFVALSIGTSYENAQRKMARGMAGSATLSVTATDGMIHGGDIPNLSSLGACVGMLEGKALYQENGYYETIDLIAADMSQLNQINPPRLLNGREATDFTGYQVILPDRFTSKYGIEQGDTITLQVGGHPIRLEVAEIAAYDTVFLRHTRGATALIPLSTLAELLGQTDGFHKILIEPADGISTAALKTELTATLPNGAYRVTEVVDEAKIEMDARQKSMPFFLISFFALTMSVYIIFSSYQVITLDRLPVIGTFRSIGATQKIVTRILLLESLMYGGVGGLIGIPVGVLALKLILQGMGHSLSQGIAIPAVISPFSLMISLAVAVMVSLLSAWLPVRRASHLPIKSVVLGTVEEKRASRRFVVAVGVVLFVVSSILPRVTSGTMLYLAGGFSLLGLLAATILIVPLLTNLLSKGLEHVYGVCLGNEGRLAARNLYNNKNTWQNITLLFISVSAVIAITMVGNFVTTYICDVFKGAELEGFADGNMEPAFVDQVKEMDGVKKVLPLYVWENQVQGNGVTFTRLEATDNLTWYNAMMAIQYPENRMAERAVSAFTKERAILLSKSCMERTGFAVGDPLTLTNGAGKTEYVVVGSFQSRATDVEAVISSTYAGPDFGATCYDFLAYTAADPDAVMVQIRDLFGDTPNWSRTVEEFNTDALATVGAFLQPMHSMTYFILLLATVGVINNLLINAVQKRRTIAIYRSVGLSHEQNVKITLLEGVSSGLLGAGIAIVISYMEIQTIFLVAGPKISMAPELNIATFLSAGAMGIVVTLIGSIVPIFKSRNMKLVDEIKFE